MCVSLVCARNREPMGRMTEIQAVPQLQVHTVIRLLLLVDN